MSVENWHPISLLTIDYKNLALVFAKRFKTGLDDLISETQSGFIKNRHIMNNIRLVLDLLHYSDEVHSEAFTRPLAPSSINLYFNPSNYLDLVNPLSI